MKATQFGCEAKYVRFLKKLRRASKKSQTGIRDYGESLGVPMYRTKQKLSERRERERDNGGYVMGNGQREGVG